MENRKIRWGLLGAGGIVNRWIKGANQVEDMEIVAVASRTRERAKYMADLHGITDALSYDEMLQRDDIDVVYIPVAHLGHKDLTIRALKAGKAVLVEKPAATNLADFQEMAACAKENQTFLMEAVWTRFFPLIDRIHELIGDDGIGDVRTVQSAFSFRVGDDRNNRILDRSQAGGGMIDAGVYNMHFADMVLQKQPVKIMGLASMDTDYLHLDVDEQAAYVTLYDKGELGIMASGIRTEMIDTAYIFGTKGYIRVPVFWKPTQMDVVIGGETTHVEEKVPCREGLPEDEGFQYEVRHVNECVRKGLIESPVMTWEKSMGVLRQCDTLRKDWGLKYPGDTF